MIAKLMGTGAVCAVLTTAASAAWVSDLVNRVRSAGFPSVIHECDVNCNTLTLANGNYVVPAQPWEHPYGPVIWKIESFKPELVALHRTFPVNQVFRGRIGPDGESLVDVTVDGRPADIKFSWGASLEKVAGSNAERDRRIAAAAPPPPQAPPMDGPPVITVPLPELLHECDSNCNTLKLEDGHYVIVTRYSWDKFNGPIVWTVERFTDQAVRLHRTYPLDQVFEGEVSADGSSVKAMRVNSVQTDVRISWGAALDTVYGNNEERDRAKRSDADNRAIAFLVYHSRNGTCPPHEDVPPFGVPSWVLRPPQAAQLIGREFGASHDVFTRCFLYPQNPEEEKSFEKFSREYERQQEEYRQQRHHDCVAANPRNGALVCPD